MSGLVGQNEAPWANRVKTFPTEELVKELYRRGIHVCRYCHGDPPGRCEGCDGVGYLVVEKP